MARHHRAVSAMAAGALTMVCSVAIAQDFVFEPGRPPTYETLLIQVGDTASTVARHLTPGGGVFVMGSRYIIGSFFDPTTQTQRVHFYDMRTGQRGWVPGIVLEGTVEESSWIPSPRMVADDLHPRVFIWHRHRVSVLDCETLQLRDLLTADPLRWTLPDGTVVEIARDLTFAPEANLLFLRRTNPDDGSFETAVVDADSGAVVRRIPATAAHMSVNRAGTRLLLSSYPIELHLVNVTDGTFLRVPYPPDIESWPFSEDLPRPAVLDEARSRIIVPVSGGFYALNLQLEVLTSVGLPRTTDYWPLITSAFVSRATGRTFLRWTGPRRSGAWVPGPCFQAVLRPDDSLARIEDLSTLGATRIEGCGGYFGSVPATPTALHATVEGRRATLTWVNPGDVAGFEIEVGTAPGRTDLRVPIGPVTTVSVDDVPAGTYFVRVRGVNEFGPGVVSDTLTVSVP